MNFELIDHIPIYSNNITSNIITNNEYIIYIYKFQLVIQKLYQIIT